MSKLDKKFVKDAIKRIREDVLEMERFFQLLEAIDHYGSRVFVDETGFHEQSPARHSFFNALRDLRSAVATKYHKRFSDAMLFSAITDDLDDLFLENLKKHFNEEERTVVVHFLENHGRLPCRWDTETEEGFRKEVSDAIKEKEKSEK